MRNIKLIIAYDGTGYSGWQRQKGPPTIQGVLEDTIALMTNEPVTCMGLGALMRVCTPWGWLRILRQFLKFLATAS